MHETKHSAHSPEAGIALIDSSLKPIAMDRGAAAIFSTSGALNGPSGWQIPTEIVDFIRTRKPSELSSMETSFRLGNCEYVCKAFIIEPLDGPFTQPIVALHLERNCDVDDIIQATALKHNLTNREQEALRGISLGFSSKELATRMNISPNTARAFSRLIMIKMDVRSRAGVAAKLLQVRDRKKLANSAKA
ncbi:MAG: helix-turn-helix transcriptional regulator [Acidobacteriota bacterium]|nr:helix-turn-helix transcriptional regulator [Acidobacteriota bacterium]